MITQARAEVVVTARVPTTPEHRASELLKQEFEHGPRAGRTSPRRLVRALVERATLTARHYRHHVDAALLEAVQVSDERRGRDVNALRREVRDALAAVLDRVDGELPARQADLEARVATAASLAAEVSEAVNALSARVNVASSESQSALTTLSDDLAHAVRALRRELEGVRAGAQRGSFLFAETTAPTFMSDPSLARTHDVHGHPLLGFRDGPGAEPLSLGFQNIFAGSFDFVRERQRCYVDLLRDREPVVDVGCGRGEMLTLLDEAGIVALGVDVDPVMVRSCHDRGLVVALGDGIDFLEQQAPTVVGAVFAGRVLEHLGAEDVTRFLRVAFERLAPGGLWIAETVNPHSPRAFKSFWVDPTRRSLFFPETLLALARLTGYGEAVVSFPHGCGDLEEDLQHEATYAVVARKPA